MLLQEAKNATKVVAAKVATDKAATANEADPKAKAAGEWLSGAPHRLQGRTSPPATLGGQPEVVQRPPPPGHNAPAPLSRPPPPPTHTHLLAPAPAARPLA